MEKRELIFRMKNVINKHNFISNSTCRLNTIQYEWLYCLDIPITRLQYRIVNTEYISKENLGILFKNNSVTMFFNVCFSLGIQNVNQKTWYFKMLKMSLSVPLPTFHNTILLSRYGFLIKISNIIATNFMAYPSLQDHSIACYPRRLLGILIM